MTIRDNCLHIPAVFVCSVRSLFSRDDNQQLHGAPLQRLHSNLTRLATLHAVLQMCSQHTGTSVSRARVVILRMLVFHQLLDRLESNMVLKQ